MKLLQSLLLLASAAVAAYGGQDKVYTTNAGAPIDDAVNSQTVGSRGPILLQDTWLVERLQVHNRERIPERNVHARGFTAKGNFTLMVDWSNTTMAKLFNGEPGKKTPIACRWSTVIHSNGSPEFLRDPRGFAVKHYTEEGNYDIVGLNFPIFFIRDGIRFPEMIRSLKPNPKTGVQEWWRIWDYFSNFPESLHMFSWLLDDVGIPAGWELEDGWGIHTYKWVNATGSVKLVRYYWKSRQGVESLQDDEAVQKHFSFASTQMHDKIAAGNYPTWDVYVQILDPSEQMNFSFDVLDTTKQWPESEIPMHYVGYYEFDTNVDSWFLENEMVAFSPGRLVPGIEPSDEKMFQTRIFAYSDTQRYRLGVNYQMLPVNKPKCPFQDNHIDGFMNFGGLESKSSQEINYFPSSIDPSVHVAAPYPHEGEEYLQAYKIRQMINKTDDYEQPRARYLSFDEDRQNRFAMRLASTYSGERMDQSVFQTWMRYWQTVDLGLYQKILANMDSMKFAQTNVVSLENMNEADATKFLKGREMMRLSDAFFKSSGSSA